MDSGKLYSFSLDIQDNSISALQITGGKQKVDLTMFINAVF
jgi:hypothetical protein